MNYHAHYERLIQRARNRILDGYLERHHVVPKCMGGSNERENIVQLTAEEHYVAHQLLHKIYPTHHGLAFAVSVMVEGRRGSENRRNKFYGWIKRKHALAVSASQKEVWAREGYKQKHKAIMDAVRERPGYREQFSIIHKGRVKSPDECANVSKAKTGMKYKKMSDESRANMSAARRKVWAERRANGTDKLIAAKTRETRIRNDSYRHTDEQRARISLSQRGRIILPEQRAKIRASMKRYRASIN